MENGKFRRQDLSFAICHFSFAISQPPVPGAPVGTRTLLPGLRDLCFAIKASSANLVLAAGFEPASTSLEERRLVPLGHASNSSGDEGTRTLDSLVDNQVH
jgi:hypothetical protein